MSNTHNDDCREVIEFLEDVQVRAILTNSIPNTGAIGASEFMKYADKNPAGMKNIMQGIRNVKANILPAVDFESYDYSKLRVAKTVQDGSQWLFTMEILGYTDASGKKINTPEPHNMPGVQPLFVLYCSASNDKQRFADKCIGPPNSDFVLRIIQKAIAQPLPPLKPGLPSSLYISFKFSQHLDKLEPFLNSLPKSFKWEMESREEGEEINDVLDEIMHEYIPLTMLLAEEAKSKGNRAYVTGNGEDSLQFYFEAIKHLDSVISVFKPTPTDKMKAEKLKAICLANQAAVYLLPGQRNTSTNLEAALRCCVNAERADPSYVKAYIRQANVLVLLQRKDDAIDVLVKALKRKELQGDVSIVDRLIGILTGGKGLSNDEAALKRWVVEINNGKNPGRELTMKGEWGRRINAQLKRVSANGNGQKAK